MRRIKYKVGMVIGVTVVLTFPVTVVSGAGSQKKVGPAAQSTVTTNGVPTPKGVISGTKKHTSPIWYSP